LENFEMKKTLVAVAALAAFSGAFAQATISGVINYELKVDGTDSTMQFGPNGGNEFTVASGEDLGNGLKASGAVTVINTGGTVPFQTYNSYIGVDGGFGSVKLGSQWSPMFFASTISDPLGRWGSVNLTNPAQLQNNNSVTYTSPSIAGVTIQYQQQLTGGTAAPASAWLNTGTEATAYSITYSNSGFNAAYASNTDKSIDTTLAAASYDFGMASIHWGNLNHNSKSSSSIGVSVPFGAMAIKVASSSGASNTSALDLQLTYALGKKTMAYLSQFDGGTAATTYTAAGLKHAF
jgi:hypothetical protein